MQKASHLLLRSRTSIVPRVKFLWLLCLHFPWTISQPFQTTTTMKWKFQSSSTVAWIVEAPSSLNTLKSSFSKLSASNIGNLIPLTSLPQRSHGKFNLPSTTFSTIKSSRYQKRSNVHTMTSKLLSSTYQSKSNTARNWGWVTIDQTKSGQCSTLQPTVCTLKRQTSQRTLTAKSEQPAMP